MAKPSVAIRLGTEGKAQVKNDFAEIAQAGDATAQRLAATYDQQAAAAERAAEKAARTAAKIASIAPQTAMQMQVNQSTGSGFGADYEGSARRSALAMKELLAEQERMEAQARRMVAAIDPMFAAQLRYDTEVAKATELHRAGVLSAERYQQVMLAEGAALEAATIQQQRHGAVVSRNGMVIAQAGNQFQDFFIQVGGGQNVLMAATMQISQLGAVMQASGGASKFATAMASPWTAVILTAVSALGIFLPKLLQTSDAIDDETKRLEENREKTLAADAAKQAYGRTAKGLIDTIHKETEALREQNRTLEDNVALAKQAAIQKLTDQRNNRIGTANEIDHTEMELQAAQRSLQDVMRRPTGENAGLAVSAAQRRVDELQARLVDLRALLSQTDASIEEAKQNLRTVEFPLAERDAKHATDKISAINDRYDDMAKKAKQAAAGNDALAASLRRTLTEIERQREAALKAARESQSSERDRAIALLAPVNGPISSGFGPRARPTAGASTYHPALDYAVPVGTGVKAGAAGVVVHAGKLSGFGNAVIIDYGNNVMAQFSHLSAVLVKPGEAVERGEVVARSGNTGISTGPHLDYRLKVNGAYVDPRKPVNVGKGVGDALGDYEKDVARQAKDAADELKRLQQEADGLRQMFDPASASAEALAEQLGRIAALKDAKVITPEMAKDWAWLARAQAGGKRLADEILPTLEPDLQAEGERGANDNRLATVRGDLADRRAMLDLELSLSGKNEQQRQRALQLRQRELELIRQFGPEYAGAIRLIMDEEGAQAGLEAKIDMVRRNLDELQRYGEDFVDTIFNAKNWDDFVEWGKRALMELAVMNPIKNMLFGQSNSTIGSIIGAIGALGGKINPSTVASLSGDVSTMIAAHPGAFATGTEYASGGLAWVGENGRELVSLPRGSKVTPAAESRRIFSAANDRGGDTHVHVYAQDAVLADTVRGWVLQGMQAAAASGAAGGAALGQAEAEGASSRRLGRWG